MMVKIILFNEIKTPVGASSERLMSESLSCSFKWQIHLGCIRKLRQLTCCLAALSGNDFKGSVFAWRHLMKRISDRLLGQRNGLMIYNKIERVLVITK